MTLAVSFDWSYLSENWHPLLRALFRTLELTNTYVDTELARSLAAEEFVFLRSITDRIAKVTLPSPTLFANLWTPERSRSAYPRFDDFMADVVAILVDEVRELARLGCRYLQLDAPHYPLLIDPGWRAFYEARGWPLERWLSYGVELDNAVIDAAPGVTFGFHLCKGNQDSRWLVAGGYVGGLVFLVTVAYAEFLVLVLPVWVTAISIFILLRGPRSGAGWSSSPG